ncbi:hypothetical protein [Nitrospira sp. BLG_1]|uniref:hypothetical protein n=1 Tax=Nitrospira sp. BLG_1 TaxID=3395883 RepID=UPI0039BC3D5D
MKDHADSSGTFHSGANTFEVDIITKPWREGFITDIYIQQFSDGKEVSRKHESIETENATGAHNLHKQAELRAASLGEGYLTRLDHFAAEITIEQPLEIHVKKNSPQEPRQQDRTKTENPNNNRTENIQPNTIEKSEQPPPQPEQRSNTTDGNNNRPENQSEAPDDFQLSLGDVALGAGKALLFTGIGIGVGVAAGPIVGAGIGAGFLIHSFMNRSGEAFEQGAGDGAAARALAAGIGDILPINPFDIGEVIIGKDVVTRRQLTNSERNERLGSSIGGALPGIALGGMKRAKDRAKEGSIKRMVLDPETENILLKSTDIYVREMKKVASRKDLSNAGAEASDAAGEAIAREFKGKKVLVNAYTGITKEHSGTSQEIDVLILGKGGKMELLLEFKRTAFLRKDGVMVTKGREAGIDTINPQTQGHEIFSKNHDVPLFIVNSRGEIYGYDLGSETWSRVF